MIAAGFFLLVAIASVLGARFLGQPDLMLLAAFSAMAALFFLLVGRRRRRRATVPAPEDDPRPVLVVDGSNVLYWKDETPQIETLREVLDSLRGRGFNPGVVFDASAGYRVAGRYQDDHDLAWALGLPEDRVLVVPKGTPADPYILATARNLKARIVTNDRYRDWAEAHPEVRTRGHLIRGGYRNGRLWLEL